MHKINTISLITFLISLTVSIFYLVTNPGFLLVTIPWFIISVSGFILSISYRVFSGSMAVFIIFFALFFATCIVTVDISTLWLIWNHLLAAHVLVAGISLIVFLRKFKGKISIYNGYLTGTTTILATGTLVFSLSTPILFTFLKAGVIGILLLFTYDSYQRNFSGRN